MSERDPELDDVPDEILGRVIEFVMQIRGVHLSQVLEHCRQEALRQCRRERIARLDAIAAKQTPKPDALQTEYEKDWQEERDHGWAVGES